MATISLSWDDNNAGSAQEDGFRLYRSESAFTSGSLPAVLTTLAADVETYLDTTAPDTTAYYMLETFKSGFTSQFTPLLTVSPVSAGGTAAFVHFVEDTPGAQTSSNGSPLTDDVVLEVGTYLIITGLISGSSSISGVTVGGDAATEIVAPFGDTNARLAAYTYENLTAGTKSVSMVLGPGLGLDRYFVVYKISGTVTALTTLPQTIGADDAIVFVSSTVNQAAAIPTATAALTEDAQVDYRSNENMYAAHLNGATTLSTNATLSGTVSFLILTMT